MDPCKPEVGPGAREESSSPAWLAASAIKACDTTKVYIWRNKNGKGLVQLRWMVCKGPGGWIRKRLICGSETYGDDSLQHWICYSEKM